MAVIEERLARVRYRVDPEPHIRVDASACGGCPHHACVLLCPAGCFSLDAGALRFAHEGCLECGTCRVACDRGAVHWDHPKGGYGVTFRFG